MDTNVKIKCRKLKAENPTWGYKRIAKAVGCAPNTVRYHLDDTTRLKYALRTRNYRKSNPLRNKLRRFGVDFKWHMRVKQMNRKDRVKITLEELTHTLGETPVCYLTGRPINLELTRSYHLDHKLPKSRGGDNSLENLGLTCRAANQAKNDMTVLEFISFCKEVLEHNGFEINIKNPSAKN